MKFERLANSERHLRRTAMDALEILREEAGFRDEDQAMFHVGLFQLPSSDVVGLVDLQFSSSVRGAICCVALPTTTHFEVIPNGFPVHRRFEIARLDKAQIDGNGHGRFQDGNEFRALKIEPTRLPNQPSDLDWRIVHLTLELVDAKHCYRSLREGLPPDQQALVPDFRFLDLARISGLELPPLKDIARFIASKYGKVSGQQIANSLRAFGIRHPQARST